MMSESDCKSLAEKIAPAAACDVRPCATIRIGAIGHRNIDDTNGKIAGTVKTVLSLVRRSAEEALKQPDVRERWPDLVIVSPLAEGADRLIARAGIELNCRLGAILPFDIPDYEATFDPVDRSKAIADFRALLDTAAPPHGYGVLVLDGDAAAGPPRDAAFANCARAVTRRSDILIAILAKDRTDSRTGCSVREAVDIGVPVVVIDPRQPAGFSLRHRSDGIERSSSGPARRLDEFIVSMLARAPSGKKLS